MHKSFNWLNTQPMPSTDSIHALLSICLIHFHRLSFTAHGTQKGSKKLAAAGELPK